MASIEAAAGASSTGAPTTAAASSSACSSAPRLLTAHSSVGRHAWKSQQQWLQAREQSWAEKSDFAAADDDDHDDDDGQFDGDGDDDDDDGQFDGDGDVDGGDAARESAPQHFARAASLPEGPLGETSGPGQGLHGDPLGIDGPAAPRGRAAGSTASLPAERGTPPLWRHSTHDGGGGDDGDLSPRARSQTLLAPGSSSSARAAAAAAAKASSSSHKAGKGERDQAALFDWFAERNFLRAKTKHSHEKGGDKGDRQLRTPRT